MSFIGRAGKSLADIIPGLGKLTFDKSAGKIFVTSGTGVIGYRVAVSLLEAGQDVRVGVWKGDRQGMDASFGETIAEALEAKGAEVIEFDWASQASYTEALTGVKTVFCTLPHIEGWAGVFPSFLKVCKQMKIEHFVKISFLRPINVLSEGVSATARMYRENVPFVAFHGTCDDILEQSKNDSRISYTILCTSHLMATPLLTQGKLLREQHKYVSASYGMGVNYVSPNDFADAAVVVLLDQKPHRNKVYNLTGPRPIRDSDVVELLSQKYGAPIEHIQLGYHDYAKDVRKRGLPDWQVRDAASMERMKAHGLDEHRASYTDDIYKITGKQAETFEGYLYNTSCMRPGLTFP